MTEPVEAHLDGTRPIVLSIDIDAFVSRPVTDAVGDARPRARDHTVASLGVVEAYATEAWHLFGESRLPGSCMVDHDHAFYELRTRVEDGRLPAPFDLVNIDAHADLGMGDPGWVHLLDDVIPLEPDARPQAVQPAYKGLNLANWVAFSLGCRWVQKLVHGHELNGPLNDLFPYYRAGPGKLQIPQTSSDNPALQGPRPTPDAGGEPVVEFLQLPWNEVSLPRVPDLLLVCRSPRYTPQEADALFLRFCDAVRTN